MGLWSRAAELAAKTPPSRNRTVDFLRAASILCVVFGHWLAAAPVVDAGGVLHASQILSVAPWTRWLTWAIQVMPVFFMVGGFSNGLTWRAAQRDGRSYSEWLESRLRRLIGPVLPLLVVWAVLGVLARWNGTRPEMIRIGSQMALIPTWFLAVYVGVVALVPLTYAAWTRWGMSSFWALVAAAVAVDFAFFGGARPLGWVNYLFVWSAVHQLGYAWSEGKLGEGKKMVWLFAAGLALLVGLTELGPYPRAMVGVPGEPISNTTPPKITLLALAAAQLGLVLTLQPALRRWLARARPWTATVLVNAMIMTVYLWHLTAMILLIALSDGLGGIGLRVVPGSRAWWLSRPLWFAVLGLVLLPLVLAASRFERPKPRSGPAPAALRLIAGAVAICAGLALLAHDGIAGTGPLGLRPVVLSLPFVGALLVGMSPRRTPRGAEVLQEAARD